MKQVWTRRQFAQTLSYAGLGLCSFRGTARAHTASAQPVVDTALGSLRGSLEGGVRVFRGVPFAEPPVADLRFRPTVPKRPWTGVRNATHFSAASMQPGDHDTPQSEDCLYLNVWTPPMARGAKPLPVFVWIHGGGFTGGEAFSPLFDGTVFAKQGIVVVTVAYRLGVLGFLDVEPLLGAEFAGSANNALRDLVTALAFVQRHIGAFGGDPHRVTIGGESAGAKLSDILLGVPQASPLFQGVISESGGAERIWYRQQSQGIGQGFGRQWAASGSGRSAATLRTAPARELIDVQTEFLRTWPQHFPLRCEVDGSLVAQLPVKATAAGSARGKRLLIGTNRDESALFLGAHPKRAITAADLGNATLPEFQRVLGEYGGLYPDMPEDRRLIRAVTAEEYWVPSVRVAEAAAQAGAQVWAYELDYGRSGGPYPGEAYHSEDLGLVWDKPRAEYAGEAQLATQVNAAWAAFLRGEMPGAPGLPAWPEYNGRGRQTMMLDTTSRVEGNPQGRELQLWDGLLQTPPGAPPSGSRS